MLSRDAGSQLLAQPLRGFQYQPRVEGERPALCWPTCQSLTFPSSPGLGRTHQREEPGPSQAKQENHVKEANPRILLPCSHPKSCKPAHRTALRPALWLLHSIPTQYSRAVGCCHPHPNTQCPTPPRPAFSVWPSRPALIGSLPYRDLGASCILSHLCVGVTEGSRTYCPPHPPPRLQCLYPAGAP